MIGCGEFKMKETVVTIIAVGNCTNATAEGFWSGKSTPSFCRVKCSNGNFATLRSPVIVGEKVTIVESWWVKDSGYKHSYAKKLMR